MKKPAIKVVMEEADNNKVNCETHGHCFQAIQVSSSSLSPPPGPSAQYYLQQQSAFGQVTAAQSMQTYTTQYKLFCARCGVVRDLQS